MSAISFVKNVETPVAGVVVETVITAPAESIPSTSLATIPAAPVGPVAAMDFLESRRSEYPGHTFLSEVYMPIDNDIIEVSRPPGTLPEDFPTRYVGTTAGYGDAAIISADGLSAEVVRVAVEKAENNLQGAAYALGLLHAYPALQSVMVWFVMPHRDSVSGYLFNRAELDKLLRQDNAKE